MRILTIFGTESCKEELLPTASRGPGGQMHQGGPMSWVWDWRPIDLEAVVQVWFTPLYPRAFQSLFLMVVAQLEGFTSHFTEVEMRGEEGSAIG